MLTVNKEFYKGTFQGLFVASNKRNSGKFVFSDIHWTYLKIENVEKLDEFNFAAYQTGDYWFKNKIFNKNGFHPFRKKTNILIPRAENLLYSGDLYNVLIKNIDFKFNNRELTNPNFYEAKGDIYFQIEIAEEKKAIITANNDKTIGANVIQSDSNVLITGLDNHTISDTELVTPILQPIVETNNINRGCWPTSFFYKRRNSGIPINDPLAQNNKGCFNTLGTIFWSIILIYSFMNSMPMFWVLLVIAILWGITRFFFKNFFGRLFTFALIILIGYYVLSVFYKKGQEIVPKQTKQGRIKVSPPREEEKKEGSREKDLLNAKSISWFDFKDINYNADYSTSSLSYENTKEHHNNLVATVNAYNNIQFYNKVYDGLNAFDAPKVNELVNVFRDSAVKMRMNSLQLAEMVTTFIQEIPYVLVHDASCNEASKSGGFVKKWHREDKPCLANIPAGVQSPYEFIHNLKGDCDTRTLLAFTMLKKLDIPVSIWVSETYGHSILGIGLPFASGFHKNIQGLKHYSVELTSKQMIGFVSPDQNDESNWDIAIYYQP